MGKKNVFLAVVIISLVLLGLKAFPYGKVKGVSDDQSSSAGSEKRESLAYECQEGKNVLDLLREKVKDVKTKDYSFGKMVSSINNTSDGADGRYWIYYVDDQAATVSADSYVCKDSERIDWRLEKGVE